MSDNVIGKTNTVNITGGVDGGHKPKPDKPEWFTQKLRVRIGLLRAMAEANAQQVSDFLELAAITLATGDLLEAERCVVAAEIVVREVEQVSNLRRLLELGEGEQ